MFKADLKAKLERIFDLDKVTFDRPGESQEQECVFVEIESARCSKKDKRELAKVTGTLHIFGNGSKIPYGYFTKKIAEADPADTRNLAFFNFESNKGTFQNIAERSLEFLFLYDSQYDPAVGIINEINLSFSES